MTAYTDNKSLHDAVHTTKETLEKRLIVDILALREMVDRNEVQIGWTEEDKQITDVLTKWGAPQKLLLERPEPFKMLDLWIKIKKK